MTATTVIAAPPADPPSHRRRVRAYQHSVPAGSLILQRHIVQSSDAPAGTRLAGADCYLA